MKKHFLFMLCFAFMAVACEKTELVESRTALKAENSTLINDWIGLHLRVIKNTSGVTHIAYSRHFSYTGVALYETLVNGDNQYKSVAGLLSGTLELPEAPEGKPLHWAAAANAAVADMLRYFYPAKPENVARIDSLEQAYFAKYQAESNPAEDLGESVKFGSDIAAAVIAWSQTDGADAANIPYIPLGEGYWKPTPNGFAAANMPGWKNNRTIMPGSTQNTLPVAPLPFSSTVGSPFYNMAREVYDISLTRTPEQIAIALFWDDAPNGQYVTAFGHWFSILKQVLDQSNLSLMKAAEAYLRLGITMNDATISVWNAKYTYHQLRPVTYMRDYMGIADWNSIISTPPHPEYTAAHATISASAGYALESVFGKNYAFTDHTYDGIGMNPRSYNSFEAAGLEAGMSRLYAGIHYRPSIETGNAMGKKVGSQVKTLLKTRK